MKILVVAPWAPSVMRPRSLGLITYLAKHHDVIVVAAAWDPTEITDLSNLPVRRVIPVKMNKVEAYIRCLLGLFTGKSLQQAYVNSRKLRGVIRQTIADEKPDLGFFNVIRSAQFADEFTNIPLVIDLDEFRSRYYSMLSRLSRNVIWKVVATVEARRMRTAEGRVLEQFDRVLVSSPTDLGDETAKVHLVRSPYAVETALVDHEVVRSESEIIFVGRQSYRANNEAISWFAKNVMPELKRRVPASHLSIVGDAPPRGIRKLQSSSIAVTGRVPDVARFYRSAALSVIPVTMATGVQMKLIESMISGTPVVATPIVAAGAGVDERHCFIAESVEDWIAQVEFALTDRAETQRRAAAAEEWAAVEYSIDSIERSLENSLVGLSSFESSGERL